MPRILRTPSANQDLLEVWTYVAVNGDVIAADGLLDAIDQRCNTLAEFPHIGRRREELAPGLRSFPEGQYLVFYREMPDGIEIVRVLHGSRDVRAVFGDQTD